MKEHILAAVKRLKDKDVFVHIGLHQETAKRYGPRVVEAVKAVRDQVVFETLQGAAKRTGLLK
jgi:hypothetical protein